MTVLPDLKITSKKIGGERACEVSGLVLEPVVFSVDEIEHLMNRISMWLGIVRPLKIKTPEAIDQVLSQAPAPITSQGIHLALLSRDDCPRVKLATIGEHLRVHRHRMGWKKHGSRKNAKWSKEAV